jgi:tetratricopeptide (TPR) repeat protein
VWFLGKWLESPAKLEKGFMYKKMCFVLVAGMTAVFSQPRLEMSGDHLDEALMQRLIELFHVDVLVETGTYMGTTAEKASKYFKEVHTVELSEKLHKDAQERLKAITNIHCHQGHSGDVLKALLPKVEGRVLFWLDAHWSGGVTALGTTKSAIRDELSAINASVQKENCVILIDDIRAFHGKKEDAAFFGGYPTLKELQALLPANYEFYVLGDVAIAYPKSEVVEVSPLVKAVTTSRFYDIKDPMTDELLSVEEVIRKSANEEEAQVIDRIYRDFVTKESEKYTTHYLIWEGLLSLERKNFAQAAKCFERAIARKYNHWRIHWYLAQAQAGSGNIASAKLALREVMKEKPKFEGAITLLEKIKGRPKGAPAL